ncbi:LTA synthase family protein [Colwellia demingiae]|uniref:LTA synthase family protein n=1 Tax=Colwellia demingiae TaxID=89401 RepID=A0A5C6QQZ4_9GAMM|nr:LTA synthase family protein [Colwellia demingiae]TWX71686.1 LTA synthase family protein [Colwellia demingiae]
MKAIKLFRPFAAYTLSVLFFLAAWRCLLMLWQQEIITNIGDFLAVLINGIRIDISSLAYLLAIPLLLHCVVATNVKINKYWFIFLKAYFLLIFVLFAFFEFATVEFIVQYSTRPNRLFIEYLSFPKEVFGMLLEGHLFAMIFTLVGVLVSTIIYLKIQKVIFAKILPIVELKLHAKLLTSIAIIMLTILAARGTVGHRPINPSLVYFSNDPLINSLTLNSMYSVAFALKQFGDEKNAAKMYGNMSEENIFRLVKKSTLIADNNISTIQIPTLVKRAPYFKGKPKNLVIVLEESLGAKHVGALGGQRLTPNLDKLINEGWAFNQMYATGTRSVRGIEAVITGFTPTPSRSVVKLDKSQRNFYTIAQTLKNNGYATQFIYGGESHFDNMKSFFLGNGFTDIVDFDDIDSPEFVGSWGASDGDLFSHSIKELNTLDKKDSPFFSLIFTSSNHTPFEIPANKIPIIEDESGREKAIRYADFTLGKFINEAKQQPFWEDTVFLIVADHDSRTIGHDLVPLNAFHIPAVILNSSFPNKRDNRVVSQIDLPVTMLSLLGIKDATPMLGRDLSNEYSNERIMMQYHENFAYVEDKKVTILQPNKKATYWSWDIISKTLSPTKSLPELGEKALAHALFGSIAYDRRLYTVPPSKIEREEN